MTGAAKDYRHILASNGLFGGLSAAELDRVLGFAHIESHRARETLGKMRADCKQSVTEFGNCARKMWDPYAVRASVTKFKRKWPQELDRFQPHKRKTASRQNSGAIGGSN